MRSLVKRATTILARPSLGLEFASWIAQKRLLQRGPTRKVHGAVLGGFSGFSEFHSVARFIDQADITFLTRYKFGPGDIVDIGANLGVVCLALAARYPDRRVFAFEPNPSTFQALKANISRNRAGNICALDLAVSDSDGELLFDANPTDRGTAALSTGSSTHSVKVVSKTLDTIVRDKDLKQIGLLKVDVEGFEAAVFAGATHVLQTIRPSVIFFEVCPVLAVSRGFDPAGAARKLVESGYRLFQIKPAAALSQTGLSAIARVDLENWVALPE